MSKVMNKQFTVNPGSYVLHSLYLRKPGDTVPESLFIQNKRVILLGVQHKGVLFKILLFHDGDHLTDTGLYQPGFIPR